MKQKDFTYISCFIIIYHFIREEHWIRQLGPAAQYGCNDHIDSKGNLTSPGCQSENVLNLFDRTSRRHRSHDARKYNKHEIHYVSFDGLLPFVNLQYGLHHIRTRLYSDDLSCSLPLNMLHDLYESTLTLHFADVASPEHRLQGIILDISSNRLFKAVRVCDYTETKTRPFLKIKFANKGIDALNLSNILNRKSVQSNIPQYFQNKESQCISYSYTRSVASKIFNYKFKEVCSKSTSKVFSRIPYLVFALAHSFCMLHVAMQ